MALTCERTVTRSIVPGASLKVLIATPERISIQGFTSLHGEEDHYSKLKIETPNQQHNCEYVVHLARQAGSTRREGPGV
jgi:hypothetical protein